MFFWNWLAAKSCGSETSVNQHWIDGKVRVGVREVGTEEWKILNTMYEILEALINIFFCFQVANNSNALNC